MTATLFSHSKIGQEYLNFLHDPAVKYVSLDVFDTAVYRSVQLPTDVFTAMGEDPFCLALFGSAAAFARYRIEAEKNARRHHSNKEDITLEDIYSQFHLPTHTRKQLIEIELTFEDQFLYANPLAEIILELANKYDKQVIFLSDMYLSAEEIHRLALSKFSSPVSKEKIFVSNEHNATKATGKLFLYVMEQLKLSADNLIHIGDNHHSDFSVPFGLGIKSIHFQGDAYLHQISQNERSYLAKPIPYANYSVQSTLLNPYTEEASRFYFNLGASLFGPILWDFALWIRSLHATHHFSKIFLMMREGRLFSKVLKLVAPELPVDLFYASRKSTFLLNLDPDHLNISSLNYYNYRSLSVADFYAHFKLRITNADISAHADTTLEESHHIQLDGMSLFLHITTDLKNRHKEITAIIREEHQNFLDYLKSINHDNESFLFDFGASGTAIKNIAKFLHKHNRTFKGYGMFYMRPSAYVSHFPYLTQTFLPTDDADESFINLIKRSSEVIEILFNGETTTTLSYHCGQPAVEIESPQAKEIRPMIEAFDRGIESFIYILLAHKMSKPLATTDYYLRLLARLIELPHPVEVRFLGQLHHDEGCGSTYMHRLITNERVALLKTKPLCQIYEQLSDNLWLYQKELPWIHGIISTIDPDYLFKRKGLKPHQSIDNPSIRSILNRLSTHSITHGVIYGAGQFCLELLEELKKTNFTIDAIVDTRALIQPFEIENHRVLSPKEILPSLRNNEIVIIASNMFVTEIKKTITTLNPRTTIITNQDESMELV